MGPWVSRMGMKRTGNMKDVSEVKLNAIGTWMWREEKEVESPDGWKESYCQDWECPLSYSGLKKLRGS